MAMIVAIVLTFAVLAFGLKITKGKTKKQQLIRWSLVGMIGVNPFVSFLAGYSYGEATGSGIAATGLSIIVCVAFLILGVCTLIMGIFTKEA